MPRPRTPRGPRRRGHGVNLTAGGLTAAEYERVRPSLVTDPYGRRPQLFWENEPGVPDELRLTPAEGRRSFMAGRRLSLGSEIVARREFREARLRFLEVM